MSFPRLMKAAACSMSEDSRTKRTCLDSFPATTSQDPISGKFLIGEIGRAAALKRFRTKWNATPVRVKKTRQDKILVPRSDSVGTETVLVMCFNQSEWISALRRFGKLTTSCLPDGRLL